MASFKPRPGNDDDAVNAAARAEAARGEATSWAATQDARARTISAELDQADALDTADAAWQAARAFRGATGSAEASAGAARGSAQGAAGGALPHMHNPTPSIDGIDDVLRNAYDWMVD